LPPVDGHTVYFWLAEFYGYIVVPSLIFFLVGIVMVALWFSRFVKRIWAKSFVVMLGTIVSLLTFMPAIGTAAFVSNLGVIGKVSQNHHFYYLVKHYDDEAPTYSFCESDAVGFSGICKYIGWKGDDNDPKIYVDPNTNLISVESENPSFIWKNSIPPTCINVIDENDEYAGGCTP
jgi:energy-coupling factor transporter transmembrane protein EcfT